MDKMGELTKKTKLGHGKHAHPFETGGSAQDTSNNPPAVVDNRNHMHSARPSILMN
jgi:hypothetical protein